MDLSDMATIREEQDTALALKVRRPEGPHPIGFCLNCGDSLKEGVRWCNAECRDDWQRINCTQVQPT